MKKLLLSAGLLLSAFAMNAAIGGPTEEKPLEMYAIGASKTVGVFKFNPTDWSANKISTTTPGATLYTGSDFGGGGTFLSPDKVVGAKCTYSSLYWFEATSEGDGNGPWGASYKLMGSPEQIYDMAYDEKNDIIYCWCKFGTIARGLGIYDPTSHTVTAVGNSTMPIRGLAIDADGQLWGIAKDGRLYTIDKTSGTATQVATISNFTFTEDYPSSAAIDQTSNMFYFVGKVEDMFQEYDALYRFSLEDKGAAEKVKELTAYYNCLYIVPNVESGAPAEIEDLAAAYDSKTKKTVVTFTAPSQTSDGAALSGEITYTITVDGDEDSAVTGTVEAGAEASVDIELTDGQHEISVVMSNEAGGSKAAKTTVWSGFDEPTAITNLQIVFVDGEIKLTWDAPVGKHGGELDKVNIGYTVKQGEQPLAQLAYSETSYSMTPDWHYILSTFTVIVSNNGVEFDSQETSIMAGLPYQAPYKLDLANIENLEAAGVTIFDLDRATMTNESWKIGRVKGEDEPVLQSLWANIYNTRNDYAYLPPLSLKAGVQYIFKFKMAVYTSSNFDVPAEIRLLSAASPTTDEDKYSVVKTLEIVPSKTYDWVYYHVPVTVPADGNYAFGVADILTQETIDAGTRKNYDVNLKDIAVVENFFVPATVKDLTAALQDDNNRNVDLSFTLPTTDTEAQPFNKPITKVVIYRGEEAIKTFDGSFAAGTKMEYTDENAPLGVFTYSVKVYDGEKVAEDTASVEIAVGNAYDLAVETISAPEAAVEPNGEGKITVKVTNNAYNAVEAKAYAVKLISGDETIETLEGAALAPGASAEFTYTLNYEGATPATVKYAVNTDFVAPEADNSGEAEGETAEETPAETPFVSPDENQDNNTTEEITVEFVTGAPAKVADLTATPQKDNNTAVDIAFTLPEKDVKGAKLTSISKYEIFRGEEVIKSVEGELTPGAAITITDEDAPLGPTSYTVITYNGDQASEAVKVNVAVGYDYYIAVETVSAPEAAVEPNGEGKIVVKVNNGGYEAVAADAYSVVLMSGEDEIESQEGKALEPGKDAQFTFTLEYEGETPATVTYQVNIVLTDEKYHIDNTTGDFEIKFVTGAPTTVADLKAVAQKDNTRNIDITFTLPTTDAAGAKLHTISKYEIIRDDEVISSEENATPGEAISYTDENVDLGFYNYSVITYNGDQASEAAEAEVAVGYSHNLVIKTVSAPEAAVEPNGQGKITVKVTNGGYDAAADDAYEVVLVSGDKEIEKIAGTALEAGESKEFSFTLKYEGKTPATMTYQVKVVYAADENPADNTTGDITVNFVTGAPKAISDLLAVVQEDNNRNVDVTFTLPTEDVAGAALSSITKYEILRGNDVIYTSPADAVLAPGEEIGYTDYNAPRGIRSYTVYTYNGTNKSARAIVSVKVGYINNLQVEIVSAPESEVTPDGEGKITVKVTNDGFEKVLAGAYNVVLYCGSDVADTQEGLTTLDIEASAEFTFDLFYNGETPATVQYTVEVTFDGDQNTSDNTTEPVSVTFRPVPTTGIGEVSASDIVISSRGNSITVSNAEGLHVAVYTTDGHMIVSETADADYATPTLHKGVYIVSVGGVTKKIAL